AMTSEADGSRSLGLRTKLFPAAMATGNIQHGTMHGKLKGVTPATTPRGWRRLQLSMPVETWSVKSPLRSCGMPQANSTTSMPRMTSPGASDRRRVRPGWPRGRGAADCAVHRGGVCQGHPAGDASGGRVEYILGAAGATGYRLAGYPVTDDFAAGGDAGEGCGCHGRRSNEA